MVHACDRRAPRKKLLSIRYKVFSTSRPACTGVNSGRCLCVLTSLWPLAHPTCILRGLLNVVLFFYIRNLPFLLSPKRLVLFIEAVPGHALQAGTVAVGPAISHGIGLHVLMWVQRLIGHYGTGRRPM